MGCGRSTRKEIDVLRAVTATGTDVDPEEDVDVEEPGLVEAVVAVAEVEVLEAVSVTSDESDGQTLKVRAAPEYSGPRNCPRRFSCHANSARVVATSMLN